MSHDRANFPRQNMRRDFVIEYVDVPRMSCELRVEPFPVTLDPSQQILTLVEWLSLLYATAFGI